MEIVRVVWLENIVEKLRWKHHVRDYEVIEILDNKPQFRFVEKGHRSGENVYSASGKTNTGRYLVVFFVYKKDKQAIIVSARDMNLKERKKYE